MENMQNLTAALDALGVKTCLACGKTGAKSLCTGCRSVNFCGAACQREAWRGHKKACRRVQRERARVLDAIAADYAADEAMAAEACRACVGPAPSTRVEGEPTSLSGFIQSTQVPARHSRGRGVLHL